MIRLADVVRQHGPAYMERYQASMLPGHVRALRDIATCRTAGMGGHIAECTECGRAHLFYHSCRNRACPRCGYDATARWLTKQRQLLLPVPYFHVVFTLPSELRRLVRSHQKELLAVLFRAAFDSLAALGRDPRYLGAAHIGALAVLHTWTRTLEWHPHVHMLVPAGGLAADGRTWIAPPRRKQPFLVPVRALGKLFRGRFLALARRALPRVPFPDIPWDKRWVVFSKPVVHGADKVLDYLGRYVHRTATTDKAILRCDERTITFGYRDSRQGARRHMTLQAHEFLRRFLQHVPPKGFHRVRAFGLLHPEHRDKLRRLQLLLAARRAVESATPVRGPKSAACGHCGAPLRLLRRLSPIECLLVAEALDPATTGNARGPPPATVTVTQRRVA